MNSSPNLRFDADFETKIFPNVYWVPYNSLGKTQYSDLEMSLMSNEDVEQKIQNIYELSQFVQVNNFINIIDVTYKIIKNEKWEIHKSGTDVLKTKAGCCSSYSGLAVHLLKKFFNKIYNFCIISDSGWGHAMNYIQKDGYYYFFDISSQLNEYYSFVPVETGIKSDFVKAKFITGGCFKTNKISSFIDYFLRYHLLKMTDFIFATFSTVMIPPILILKEDKCYVKFDETCVHEIYEYDINGKIKYEK